MAKFDQPVPAQLAHLRRDDKGFPLPFFVSKVEGKYDFRLFSADKQARGVAEKLCGICGKKLHKDFSYFISGPIGMKNRVSSDLPMHRLCAEFSLQACPYLQYQKADRRHAGIEDVVAADNLSPLLTAGKPETVVLIKTDKFWMDSHNNRPIIRYRYVSHETFGYENNRLIKLED